MACLILGMSCVALWRSSGRVSSTGPLLRSQESAWLGQQQSRQWFHIMLLKQRLMSVLVVIKLQEMLVLRGQQVVR